MIASNNQKETVTIFGQELQVTYNKTQCVNELVLESHLTTPIIDPNLKSTEYATKKALYFFQKSDGGFSYFYFDVNQIFFLGDHYLFIPDFLVVRIQKLQLILKEPLIKDKIQFIYLDPFCTVKCFVVDISNLSDTYILLQILNDTTQQNTTFKNGRKIVNTTNFLPEYGKYKLVEAELALKELVSSKKEMSAIHHKSFTNWLNHKEQSYIGKIPKFETFHEFQYKALSLCPQSLKLCSIYNGFLFHLFMGSGKTLISCVWLDYLRDYFNSNIRFIIIAPVGVINQWNDILSTFKLSDLVSIYSWDSWNKIDLQPHQHYFVVCDEVHYAMGDSNRNEGLYNLLNQSNIIGSLQLTGTPYTGKPGQIVWVARSLGHYWGKYPRYFKKQLETLGDCSQLVKEKLQDCIFSLTLEETLKKYPNFKIPQINHPVFTLDIADPQFNNEESKISYLKEYEECLLKLTMELQLENIHEIPEAMRTDYMKISQRILGCFELLKVDWVKQHSPFISMMESGEKIVFFVKYQRTAKQLYKALSWLNDSYHLREGNYTLKKRLGLSMAQLQLDIGKLETKRQELFQDQANIVGSGLYLPETMSKITQEIKNLDSEIRYLNNERSKLSFTNSLKSKPQNVLAQMNPSDLKLILSEEMMIDTYKSALIYGDVKAKDRTRAQDAFNSKDGGLKFLICTLAAGGTGLNLHHDCKIGVHLGIGDNFRDYEQSLMRIGRFGNESNEVTMFQIMFGNGNNLHNKMNLEQSLFRIYQIKHGIVKAINSQKFEQTPLHQLSTQEIMRLCSESLGFDDYLADSVNSQIKK